MIMKKIILFFTVFMIFNFFNFADAKYTKLAYEFNFDSIDGEDKIQLKNFENKVIVVVNVASRCGYTPIFWFAGNCNKI